MKRNGNCLFSENKIQGLTDKKCSYCAVYCFFINYLRKVLEVDFQSAAVKLYYDRFSLQKLLHGK